MEDTKEGPDMTSLEKYVFIDVRDGNIVSTAEKRLTLAYEGLTDMPRNLIEDYGNFIEILDLSHNKLAYVTNCAFRNVDFLLYFEKMTTLILDHNYITCDVIFPIIPTLTTLWLNHNLIDKLHPFIPNLGKSFPNLQILSLMGNQGAPSYLNGGSYYEYLQYRLFVISWLPNLQYLDDRPVTEDQREEAQRLYSRPFYQTLMNLPFPQYLHHVQQKFKGLVDSWSAKPMVPGPAPPREQNRII
ncbi:unnamed protein product [Allacma fusca]|uniref:Uncharacterized protein n=1 Tax=Allacma fusca TaxID=39272 RepID=A0A8J2KA60_9HEXA|nr:unnamed protein product [Allacma fusca]